MGTNVYFLSKDKNAVHKYFGRDSYALTDEPYFAYEVHVMKRSAGWLPLWQAHENCTSVSDYRKAYDSGLFAIYDEYGDKYNWEEFWEQFAMFNGGVRGEMPLEHIDIDKQSPFYDPCMPDHVPVSHFEYNYGSYANQFFADSNGFEFMIGDFS